MSSKKRGRPKKLNADNIQRIQKLYLTGNYTLSKLGEIFKVSSATIQPCVKDLKLKKRAYARNPELLERNSLILRDYLLGFSTRKIAKKFEMCHQNVSRILHSFNLDIQKRYFEKINHRKKEKIKALEFTRQAEQESEKRYVLKISTLWKARCSIDTIRIFCGLKNNRVAWSKVVKLRKLYGKQLFPYRRSDYIK